MGLASWISGLGPCVGFMEGVLALSIMGLVGLGATAVWAVARLDLAITYPGYGPPAEAAQAGAYVSV